MNNIFHKLANDAWIDAPEGQGYSGKIFSKEKFAELIVRECANVSNDWQIGNHPGILVKDVVLYHFGVEE
jgi:hypothetical protein